MEDVHEVLHMNHKLLVRIMQQNLRYGRLKESIAKKTPLNLEELLSRVEKHFRIEESTGDTAGVSGTVEKKKEMIIERRTEGLVVQVSTTMPHSMQTLRDPCSYGAMRLVQPPQLMKESSKR